MDIQHYKKKAEAMQSMAKDARQTMAKSTWTFPEGRSIDYWLPLILCVVLVISLFVGLNIWLLS